MPKYTLLDAIKLHPDETFQTIVSETAKLSPELPLLPFRTIATTTYKALVRTGNPTVGFRRANEGVPDSKATFVEKHFQTHAFDHQVKIDKLLRDETGEQGFGALMEQHQAGALEGAFDLFSGQLYYGNPELDKGFPGLILQYSADTAHEVDATGSANRYSVWGLSTKPGNSGVVFGGGRASGIDQGPWELKDVQDANGNTFQAFCSWLYGNVGFELVNKHAAMRIKNLSNTDAGKGLTDALLNQLWTKALRNKTPFDTLFMPPEAVEQLRAARTATNPTGAPAPRPTDWNGIPIVETAGILIGGSLE